MYKIRKIIFKDHPILKNLSLDFCGIDGKAVNTIIFAGENGNGKSTIINELYGNISQHQIKTMAVEIENGDDVVRVEYQKLTENSYRIDVYNENGDKISFPTDDLYAIFSDVDINFNSNLVSTVTSLKLDEQKESRRSSSDLPTQINQLLIDIQALDDADIAYAVRNNPELMGKNLEVEERMPRFTAAFNRVFDNLTYNRIENRNGHKIILFQKNGVDIPINSLSSGEKQIVYRGCFLLKDANALNGAFVFLDEPEISLHPMWQMKIMDYYKNIFTDKDGIQTSQIFAVTHSPFIIHNEKRIDDKVIVLTRDENGNIVVKDKPEYFKCNSLELIQDAFSMYEVYGDIPTVYLEGRTDEKYFNKALEIYDYSVSFQFKWIGYLKENGQEENTGKDALNKAVQFLIGRNLPIKNVCLFDCDTNRANSEKNNVYTRVIPTYTSTKKMKKGIENALILDNIDVSPYYSSKKKEGDYGDDNIITEFKKMEFCDYVCSLDKETLKIVFGNLNEVIKSLIALYKSN